MRLPFILSTILYTLYLTQKFLSENKGTSPLYRGISLGIIGLTVHPIYHNALTELRSLSLIGEPLPIQTDILNNQILDTAGFIFRNACLLSMGVATLSILNRTQNPYLRYLGKASGEKIYKKLLFFLLLGTYFQIGRSLIIEAGYFTYQLLIPLEWLIIILSFYLEYRTINRHAESMVQEYSEVEDWYKHIQKIEYTSDKKHEELTHLLRSFVENGEKSRLVTALANLLTRSDYDAEKTHLILRSLIEYNPPYSGPILFRWQVEQNEKQNQTQRELLIKKVFDAIDYQDIIEDQNQATEVTIN
jgi:hypothetical protein